VYHHIRGEISALSPTSVVVEVGGVGYDVRIPVSTYDRLKGAREARLLVHLHVREDDLRLYGFATDAERELFRLFLSVTGVGPSIALTSLSFLEPSEVARAVSSSDVKTLQKIKGVGKKLAERLVLELRDRVEPLLAAGDRPLAGSGRSADRDSARSIPEVADTVLALVALGYDRKGAEERAEAVYRSLAAAEGSGGRPSVERLVKECLRGS
jgi:Holliday junction DNA helicase RuvA